MRIARLDFCGAGASGTGSASAKCLDSLAPTLASPVYKDAVMSRIAVALLALATLTHAGCAAMGTKRAEGGAQIQRTAGPAPTLDNGAPADARSDLGQR